MTERKQRPRFLKTATSEYKLSVKMGLPSSGFFLFCRWADVFSLDT
jgi:hypothetical protein